MNRSRWAGRVLLLGGLTAAWVLYWGDLTPANVLGGLAVAVLVTAAFPFGGERPLRGAFRPVAVARLLARVAWMVVAANVSVARHALARRPAFEGAVVAVPIVGASDALVTFVGVAITLTPGTLVLDGEQGDPDDVLYVHVLDARELDQIHREIQELEVLAIRAFGDAANLRELDRRRARTGAPVAPGEGSP